MTHDYNALGDKLLRHLYHNRHLKDTDNRTRTQLINAFKLSAGTFNRILYQEVGAGRVLLMKVGNTSVHSLSESGLVYVETVLSVKQD